MRTHTQQTAGRARDAGESFGALLRRHRLAAGLTHEALAERAGLSARTISDLERGVARTPRPSSLRLLTDSLGLSPAARAAMAAAGRARVGGWTGAARPRPHALPAVARALALPGASAPPVLERLAAYLRDKRLLLVMDNLEQVVAAASLVTDLLAACPSLRVMATSRALLRVGGERVLTVPPLSLDAPGRLEQPADSEAVRLFVERAQAVAPGFRLTDENAAAVHEVCTRVDGLPLAIELAAARVGHLPPESLRRHLAAHGLHLLTGGGGDRPARHQTLRAALDWSHDLLTDEEQRLFRRLAVFRDGCTPAAAGAVAGAAHRESEQPAATHAAGSPTGAPAALLVLDGLRALVEQSLLQQGRMVEGEPRFVMLETLREYALERLEASGEAQAIRRRHAAHCAALAEAAHGELEGPAQLAWLARLEADHDNLVAALEWTLEHDPGLGLRLAGALGLYWWSRSRAVEWRRWLTAMLDRAPDAPPAVRATALLFAGVLSLTAGEPAAGAEDSAAAVALMRRLGDRRLAEALAVAAAHAGARGDGAAAARLAAEALAQARASDNAAAAEAVLVMMGVGDPDRERAMALLAEAVASARRRGDPARLLFALHELGRAQAVLGRTAEVLATFDEALALCGALGDRRLGAWVLAEQADCDLAAGDLGRAAVRLREALVTSRELSDGLGVVARLATGARLAAAVGDGERAARLLGAVAAGLDGLGTRFLPSDQIRYERTRAGVRARMGEAAFAAAFAQGRAMPLEEAVELALTGEPVPAAAVPVRRAAPPGGLTAREGAGAAPAGRRAEQQGDRRRPGAERAHRREARRRRLRQDRRPRARRRGHLRPAPRPAWPRGAPRLSRWGRWRTRADARTRRVVERALRPGQGAP
jgi:non-specific serine/threonine protein kinase